MKQTIRVLAALLILMLSFTVCAQAEPVFPELVPLAGWDYSSVETFKEKNAPDLLKEYYKLKKNLNISNESFEDGVFHYAINQEDKTARVDYYIGDPNATEIVVPAEVNGCRVITFCSNLPENATSLVLPEGLLGIYAACSMAKNLTSVTFPETLLTIQERAFYCCSSLSEVTLPDSLCLVDGFEQTALKELVVPKNVFYISGFNVCSSLTSVHFAGERILAVPNAFLNCTQLTEVNFPASLKYVHPIAFNSSSVTVPEELILPLE